MEKSKTGYIRSFINSIFDFNYYVYINKFSLHKAFVYILLLTLTCGSLFFARPIINFNAAVDVFSVDIQNKMPDFTLKNGVLEMDSKTPVQLGNTDTYNIEVDTSDTVDPNSIGTKEILFTRDAYYQKAASDIVKTTYTSVGLSAIELDKSMLIQILPILKYSDVIILLFGLPYYYLMIMFKALFVALLGNILNFTFQTGLKFKDMYKISLFALTLPLVFEAIVSISNITIPIFSFIYYFVAGIYMYKALTVIKLNE